MAQEYKYEDELDVLRRTNRALRSVNRSLRGRLKRSEEAADNAFIALCETTPGVAEFDPEWQKP